MQNSNRARWRHSLEHVARCRWLYADEIALILRDHAAYGLELTAFDGTAEQSFTYSGKLVLCHKEHLTALKKHDNGIDWVKRANTNKVREDNSKLRPKDLPAVNANYSRCVSPSTLHRRRYSLAVEGSVVHLIHHLVSLCTYFTSVFVAKRI
jgi:CG-1 domain